MSVLSRTIFIGILTICYGFTYGQAPPKFGFQSIIRDQNNVLIANALIGVKISVIQGSEEGQPVYVEIHSATTNVNGLISLVLGQGEIESGVFADIDWSQGPYFILTQADPTGGDNYIIEGTTPLLSVPYALYAASSGNQNQGPQGPAGFSGVPTGTVLSFAGSNAPEGYLLCDGSEYPISEYPELYDVIQNIWGTPVNSENFRVPDLRGLFLRGVDGTANRDPDKNLRTALVPGQNSGNTVGSFQEHAVGSHTHTIYQIPTNASPDSGGYNLVRASTNGTTQTGSGQPRTGNRSTENRPSNINILYIIKI